MEEDKHKQQPKPKRKGQEQLKQQPSPQPPTYIYSILKNVPKWAYGILVLASIAIGLAEGYPWLSIQTGEMIDPTDQFSETFQVTNGGYIPLTKLDCACRINSAFPRFKFLFEGRGWYLTKDFAEFLSHGETVTLPCYKIIDIPGGGMSGATLDIRVTYSLWRLPGEWLRRSQFFHFQSIQGRDGKQHWIFTSPK